MSDEQTEITITDEQVALLDALNSDVAQAQRNLNLVLAGVLAGHGLVNVPVLGLDKDRKVLTVGNRA